MLAKVTKLYKNKFRTISLLYNRDISKYLCVLLYVLLENGWRILWVPTMKIN